MWKGRRCTNGRQASPKSQCAHIMRLSGRWIQRELVDDTNLMTAVVDGFVKRFKGYRDLIQVLRCWPGHGPSEKCFEEKEG